MIHAPGWQIWMIINLWWLVPAGAAAIVALAFVAWRFVKAKL